MMPTGEAPTSISDTPTYRQACFDAARDPELFRRFRMIPILQRVFEPYNPDDKSNPNLQELLDAILTEPDFARDYDAFSRNDAIGGPRLTDTPTLGPASVYTLRYIKIAYDIRRILGSLDGAHIVEIGGGYGGQCAILSHLFNWASYTIVDLPEPLLLQQAYLRALDVPNVAFRSQEQLDPEQRFDTVISNYAYTELSDDLMKFYMSAILEKSDCGFMLWNYLVWQFERNGEDFIAGVKAELEMLAELLDGSQVCGWPTSAVSLTTSRFTIMLLSGVLGAHRPRISDN